MTDVHGLWLTTLQEVVGLAGHEVKNPLNGVSVNLEVVRSRVAAGKTDSGALAPFVDAAYQQLMTVIARTEALIRLGRAPRGGDASLSGPLADLWSVLHGVVESKGGKIHLEGADKPVGTSAVPTAVRLALASGFLALIKEGGVGRSTVETGPETVVRFSHESADVGDLDPAVASALGHEDIRLRRSNRDLLIAFPGYT